MTSSPAAVVRVKRKLTDNPVEALVLSFKRSRRDDDTANEVYRFTGTVPTAKVENDDAAATETRQQLKQILSDRIVRTGNRQLKKLHVADIRLKSKQESEEASRQQRENLLLSLRAIDVREFADEEEKEKSDKVAKDVSYDPMLLPDSFPDVNEFQAKPSSPVSAITCNDEPLRRINLKQFKDWKNDGDTSTSDTDYVFDYYVSSSFCNAQGNDSSVSDSILSNKPRKRTSTASASEAGDDVTEYFNNLIDVYPYNLCEEAIDYGAAEASVHVNFDDGSDEDEDSNAESNWRNEYPDEDDDFDSRYDFYDQTYEQDEEGFDEARFGDDESGGVLKNLRGLNLGNTNNIEDESGNESGENGKRKSADYDSDYD